MTFRNANRIRGVFHKPPTHPRRRVLPKQKVLYANENANERNMTIKEIEEMLRKMNQNP